MKKVSRAVRNCCLLTAALSALCISSTRATAQVMDQVPSDALVVLKINHLQDTNTKIITLLQALGVTDLVPTMKDPLATLETQLGIGPGLDPKRDAAVAVLNGTFEPNMPPPHALLIPVSDYKAFIASTTVVRTEGDVSIVHFKDNETDVFIESWGDYAALSDKKENLSGKHDGLKITGLSAKQMMDQDACVYVNFPVLKGLLQPKVKQGIQDLTDRLSTQVTDPAKLKLAQAAMAQGVNIVNEFLNNAQGTTMGMNITTEGISSNMLVEVTPDSYIGKLASSMKSSDQPLLAGLPKENYLFFGGSVQDPAVMVKLISDVIDPITKELSAMSDDGKKLADNINASKDSFATVEGGSVGVIAPTAALGQGSLLRFLAIYKGDAEKIKAADLKNTEMQNQLMKIFGVGTMDLMKTTATSAFKTINGVKFDKIQSEVNPDNTTQEAMRASEIISQIYGPDGASALVGAADAKTLLMSMGNDDDLLGQAIDSAKANKDVLTDGVKMVDAALPKNRIAVSYLGLGQIVGTALSYAKANGMNIPVQLPANLPPIGISASTDGPTLRSDVFVPTKLLQTMVQAGLQVYMQFNNRGGGGGGGL